MKKKRFLHFSIAEDAPSSKRKKITRTAAGVAAPFLPADMAGVKSSSSCFSGKEICVLNGTDSLSKQELERKIVSGGGNIVQNPGNIRSDVNRLFAFLNFPFTQEA